MTPFVWLIAGHVLTACPLLGSCWYPVVPTLVCPNGAVYAPLDGLDPDKLCARPNPMASMQKQ